MAEEVLVLAQGQFQLSRALGTGNCSLLIQDTCWGNAGTYYFRMEQGENELNYHSRAGYPEPHVLVTGRRLLGTPRPSSSTMHLALGWNCRREWPKGMP